LLHESIEGITMVRIGGRSYSKKEFEEMQKAGEKATRLANQGKGGDADLRSAANDGGKTRRQVEETKRKVRRGIGKD
jgi:hypothetical protein